MKLFSTLGFSLEMNMYFFNLLKSTSKPSTDLIVRDYIHKGKDIVFKDLNEMYSHENEPEFRRKPFENVGVPMGAGFSPLFAIMCLEMVMVKLRKLYPAPLLEALFYADDGLFYGCVDGLLPLILADFEKLLLDIGCVLKPKGCSLVMEHGQ
jgi:hypothetical protein